jgi:hypothetical protein
MNKIKALVKGAGLAILCSSLLNGCKPNEQKISAVDTRSITGTVLSVSKVYNDAERMAGKYRPVYNIDSGGGILHCFQGLRGFDYGTNYQHGRKLVFQVYKDDERYEGDRYHFFRPQDVKPAD